MSILSPFRGAISVSSLAKEAEKRLQSGEKAAVALAHDVVEHGEAWAQGVEHAAVDLAEDAFERVRAMRVRGHLEVVPHDQLKLAPDFHEADRVSRLEQSGAYRQVSLNDLPLNRTYVVGADRGPNAAIPSTGMRDQTPTGFTFDAKDQRTPDWLPQAVTTSADANPETGTVDGKRWVAVSWHGAEAAENRSRISFVDDTHPDQPDQRRYRNVELMVPDPKHPDGNQLVPLDSHVGGLSWVGHYLYVAQTGGGIRVFDVRHLLKVEDRSQVPSGTASYVLPQVGYYRSVGAKGEKPHAGSGSKPIFSGLSVDRSGQKPALLSQEYDANHPGGRIIRWPIDPRTGALETQDGVVQATDAWSVPLKRLAGIVRLKDGFRVATMGSPSGLWALHEGKRPVLEDSLAKGIQQFSYDSTTGKIWTVAEHPGHRMVWAFDP